MWGRVGKEKVCWVHRRCGQRGKEGCSRCSFAEVGMRLCVCGGVKAFSSLTSFPGLLSEYLHRECPLVLEPGILGWIEGRRLEEQIFVISWGWGQRRERESWNWEQGQSNHVGVGEGGW